MDSGPNQRHLRQSGLIDLERLNANPVCVVGVGAIGSHLAEMLMKMGVHQMILIDPDSVDAVNLGAQGFRECELGRLKVEALGDRLAQTDSSAEITLHPMAYEPLMIAPGSAVFACVDSMPVRRQIFNDYRRSDWSVLFDGRMAAEVLRVFCIERETRAMAAYEASLFPSQEAYRESCTAKATIYCATMAAAVLCASFKRWAMAQPFERHLLVDLMTMDVMR